MFLSIGTVAHTLLLFNTWLFVLVWNLRLQPTPPPPAPLCIAFVSGHHPVTDRAPRTHGNCRRPVLIQSVLGWIHDDGDNHVSFSMQNTGLPDTCREPYMVSGATSESKCFHRKTKGRYRASSHPPADTLALEASTLTTRPTYRIPNN